ncbi:MAG: hypothetical protein L6Q93_09665, partial [Phycisphaerae bacterium]|nr:hypothetical protein [Phycisphaerae bacterium]
MQLAMIYVIAMLPFPVVSAPNSCEASGLSGIGAVVPATASAAVGYKLDQGVCNDSCTHPGDVDDCAYCCPGPATCCVC